MLDIIKNARLLAHFEVDTIGEVDTRILKAIEEAGMIPPLVEGIIDMPTWEPEINTDNVLDLRK